MELHSPPVNASDGGARADDPGDPAAPGREVMGQEMLLARVEHAKRVLAKEVKSVFMVEDLQSRVECGIFFDRTEQGK